MDFIGGIQGMNFTPISNYNNVLKNSMSFDVDKNMDFENVLSKQTEALQNPAKIQGGVQINSNFDDILAQNSVQATSEGQNTGDFLNSFSNSVSGGLKSTNNSLEAANKAQETFATGGDISVHDVMIASEKASLSLEMAMQLRNKLISAYSEINNVRV